MGSPHLHPLHPVLAHFPVAFWIGASVADLIALRTGAAAWWTVSHHAVAAGTIMGALTLLAGLLELWLRKLPPAARTWVAVHASLMVVALLVFMVSLSWRTTTPPPMSAVVLSLAGCGLVLAGGYCGGTLVYRFGVGVWRAES
ncbi:MAG TPA: DUF2231 domain-containing protein [Steroidobacteraceae bacterium]|nr:DUF2231 domain-containing protein [Steroidobacteraceae bacterium]